MDIKILARTMIDRTIVQKGQTVSVSEKVGKSLILNSIAVEVSPPQDEKQSAQVVKPKVVVKNEL